VEVKEKYQPQISNRFGALENLDDDDDDDMDISITWESTEENIKPSAKESLGYYELEQHKQWLDEERS
jgi:hypothetical protein